MCFLLYLNSIIFSVYCKQALPKRNSRYKNCIKKIYYHDNLSHAPRSNALRLASNGRLRLPKSERTYSARLDWTASSWRASFCGVCVLCFWASSTRAACRIGRASSLCCTDERLASSRSPLQRLRLCLVRPWFRPGSLVLLCSVDPISARRNEWVEFVISDDVGPNEKRNMWLEHIFHLFHLGRRLVLDDLFHFLDEIVALFVEHAQCFLQPVQLFLGVALFLDAIHLRLSLAWTICAAHAFSLSWLTGVETSWLLAVWEHERDEIRKIFGRNGQSAQWTRSNTTFHIQNTCWKGTCELTFSTAWACRTMAQRS